MIVVRDADVTRLFAGEVDDFVSSAPGNSARVQQFPVLHGKNKERDPGGGREGERWRRRRKKKRKRENP